MTLCHVDIITVYFESRMQLYIYITANKTETKLRKNKTAISFNSLKSQEVPPLMPWEAQKLVITDHYLKGEQKPECVVEIGERYANRALWLRALKLLSVSSHRLWWGSECEYMLQSNHTASPPSGSVSNTSFIALAGRWRGVCAPPLKQRP